MGRYHRFRFFVLALLVAAVIIPCIPAYTMSSLVSPQGYQEAGTPMTVSFTIDFSARAMEPTFPPANELRMGTDLVTPRWKPVLMLDGKETRFPEETGQSLAISGWYLSFPRGSEEQLRVTLTGTIPENPSSRRNLVVVQEFDDDFTILSTARIGMSEAPAAPLSTPAPVTTPIRKPTTTRKTFTPIPTGTPAPESPGGFFTGIIAVGLMGLIIAPRR